MKSINKMKSLVVAAFASLSTAAFALITVTILAACGNDNTAGTDDQPNAITAQIDAQVDSASAIWFQGAKTLVADSKAGILPPYDTTIKPDTSTQHTSLAPGVATEHGMLRQFEIDHFASLSCQTEETWFTYTVQVSSSLIQKTFIIPDTSAASIVTEFEADCTRENGKFITNTEGVTEGQQSYSCKIAPTKENLVENNDIQYTDPNWEKFGKQIIKICRENTSDFPIQKTSLKPIDSTYTPPIIAVSAETEETLESWLKGNPISNMIHVDYYCTENPDYPDNPLWCLPSTIQLESGTVQALYSGTANAILCATSQDTIRYTVLLSNNIISKRWSNPFFGTDFYTGAKDEFTRSCKAENGDITEDTGRKITCDIKITPIQSPTDSLAQSPRYLLPHYSYNYDDPSWTVFATKTIELCRIRPQIEPISF